jgi:hypothetical protein
MTHKAACIPPDGALHGERACLQLLRHIQQLPCQVILQPLLHLQLIFCTTAEAETWAFLLLPCCCCCCAALTAVLLLAAACGISCCVVLR